MEKRWLPADPVSEETRTKFSELHPIVLQILWNRGLRTQQEMDVFLGPDWSRDVFRPWEFTQMRRAVDRVFQALEAGERITIHGDYDADGVCGTALVLCCLKDIVSLLYPSKDPRQAMSSFLPHREKDGYGLSTETIEHLNEHEKTKLIITVDCGIGSRAAIARGHELGMDAIVCDHHQIPEELPETAILIHPLAPKETYPNKKLCGTGVAFKFACALLEEARARGANIPDGHEKWLLDLVAVATVTDVMPLIGENRTLEKFGLVVLNKTKRVGLKRLMRAAGIQGKEVNTWNIGFQIGPRINAAGRMNHANEALELLMTENLLEADILAGRLNLTNVERQSASNELYAEAKEQVGEVAGASILFAVGKWSVGIAGLVAGKLASEFQLPVFMVSEQTDGSFVGSGRSAHGFDVTAAMHTAAHTLVKFGGHPQACGMTCENNAQLDRFMEIMKREADAYFATHDRTARVPIDAEISFADIDWNLIDELMRLRPFGEKNPEPVFVTRGVTVASMSAVGKNGEHIRLEMCSDDSCYRSVIGFHMGHWVQKLALSDKIDIVYMVQVNEWNGERNIQLQIIDLKKSGEVVE